MQIFITGTDTDIGKTLVSSWICLHTGYGYFKPIQTGITDGTDRQTVQNLTEGSCKTYPELYSYKLAASPHIAANAEGGTIDIAKIQSPQKKNIIIEGAGGIFVPINQEKLMIDLILHLNVPTIIVSSTRLGTINHTLLTIEALKSKNIKILGIIMTGDIHHQVNQSIEYYGKLPILAHIPIIQPVSNRTLSELLLPKQLELILNTNR